MKARWALFGIANQMLAAVALTTVTAILIKMGRVRYAWVTAPPHDVAGHHDVLRRVAADRLDTAVGVALIEGVTLIVVESLRQWYLLLSGRQTPHLAERPRSPRGWPRAAQRRRLEVRGAAP